MRRSTVFGCVYRHRGEAGQVALFAPVLMIVLIGGFAALAVDMGSYVGGRQQVENAVDAVALAGAKELFNGGEAVKSLANDYAVSHYPNVVLERIIFRCSVGDQNGDKEPDNLFEIVHSCPQLIDANSFTCQNGLCISDCDFTGGNKCNTIVVEGNKNVTFYLAPVLQVLVGLSEILQGWNTGTIRGSACCGYCGTPYPEGAPGGERVCDPDSDDPIMKSVRLVHVP